MASYSSFERTIARALGQFPFAKKLIKSLYARIIFARNKKIYKFDSVVPHKVCCEMDESFFGYYDRSPVNHRGFLLTHISSITTQSLPDSSQAIDIVVLDQETGKIIMRVATFAYNWQQGARAHWITDDLFIFNEYCIEKQRYVARVFSVTTKTEVKHFELPVQDSFGVDYFLALNYRRLMSLRPDYGYRNLPIMTQKELSACDDDGIWKVDYATGTSHLLISINAVRKKFPVVQSEDALHKVNHIMISPDGYRFIFMHRYLIGQRRFDRLLVADSNTGEMSLLSDFGMVSHCYWLDNRTILGFMRGPDGIDAYWKVDIETGTFTRFGEGELDKYGDGHPHVCGDWFVTDSYPDKARMQHLILANWKTGEIRHLGEFFHDFSFHGETRCDLHPRMSLDGKKVYFDTVCSGKRQLCEMELPS